MSSPIRRQQQQQQEQQQEENDGILESSVAIQEAQDVIDSEGYDRIQGFNLLGVVANPRTGGFLAHSHHHHQSHPTSPNSFSHASVSSDNSTTPQTSLQALEETLAHVTEQIDALNQVFEQWSLQYLGEYYFYFQNDESALDYMPPADYVMESQLTQLPQEFMELNLQSVQDYLESCGVLAHSFEAQKKNDTTTRVEQDEEDEQQHDLEELRQTVPDAFFEEEFDLTDPKTFCELLVLDKEETADTVTTAAATTAKDDKDELPKCLSESTLDILRLPPPDSFTRDLDRVEVALLHQVKSKSIQFFHETTRFQQLREWIASLVKDVKHVRSVLNHVQSGTVDAWELIPDLQKKRNDLQILLVALEGAAQVLQTKASIGGLLSAGDDLGAAEQIQYGRKLLEHSDEQHDDEFPFAMSRLVALGTVQDQLDQYQSLVVSNLSEELINIFLSWKMSPKFGMNPENGGNLPRTIAEARQRVRDIVRALQMCNSLTPTGQSYQAKLNNVIRIAVRTTVEQFAQDGSTQQNDDNSSDDKESSLSNSVTGMSLERFMDCLDLLFEQLLQLLKSAVGVNNFCREEGFTLKDESTLAATASGSDSSVPPPPPSSTPSTTSGRVMTATAEAVTSAAELASKSVSELLRLRKETHSLVSLEEMKRLWDSCLGFTMQLEKLSGHKAYGLRSTLLAQAKAFVERKHESNMSALVAALDSERWTKCDVSAERQAALTRLCSGRAIKVSSSKRLDELSAGEGKEKMGEAEVEGIRYKVVWSCLLLVEMLMGDLASAACFQALATNIVGKVSELLRLFNSRSTQLVLGAGAMQSAARLKSINAKHLSLVTQCLGLVIAILPHVRAALMAQLPAKQHTLLGDLDKIKKDYGEHSDKVLNKFVTIIGGIVEHGLAPRIANTNFDERAKSAPPVQDGEAISSCVFLDGVFTNTTKMHKVLHSLLPSEHLQDVFSRIFAYLDQKVPALLIAASDNPTFSLPSTDHGKRQMLLEVEDMTIKLNKLECVRPWDFSAVAVLERKVDYELRPAENLANVDEGISAEPEFSAAATTARNLEGSEKSIPTDGLSSRKEEKELRPANENETPTGAAPPSSAPPSMEGTELQETVEPKTTEVKAPMNAPSDTSLENQTAREHHYNASNGKVSGSAPASSEVKSGDDEMVVAKPDGEILENGVGNGNHLSPHQHEQVEPSIDVDNASTTAKEITDTADTPISENGNDNGKDSSLVEF